MSYLKANPGMSQLLLISKEGATNTIKDTTITNSSENLLGVLINKKLTFNDQVSKLFEKASQKIHALTCVSNHVNKEKLRILMNAFFTSQFGCYPSVWMFYSRTLSNRISRLQEKPCSLFEMIMPLLLVTPQKR